MTEAQENALYRGFTRASLLVDQDILRARAMHERRGFRAVEEVTLVHFKYWRMLRELRDDARRSGNGDGVRNNWAADAYV